MEIGFPVLVLAAVLYFYCTGGAWMLLVAGYPVHRLVGADEFAPFHRTFGRRLISAFVIPGFVAYGLTFWLLYRVLALGEPYGVSPVFAVGAACCSAINIGVSLLYVVPKRWALAKAGKSEAGIRAIEWAHLVRTLAWTVGSGLMLYMVLQAITLI